jgi:hypothetical protein
MTTRIISIFSRSLAGRGDGIGMHAEQENSETDESPAPVKS